MRETTTAPSTIPPTTASQDEDEDRELSFSFPPPEKSEVREEKGKEVLSFLEPREAPATETTDQRQPESLKFRIDESFPPPEETLGPRADEEQPSPRTDEVQSSSLSKEKEDSWSITPTHTRDEDRFTIPEENRPPRMDTPAEVNPEFEEDWQNASPPLEESETTPPLDPYRDRPLSTLPYLSLFGALLLIYSLLTVMQQSQPRTIETLIKVIPWLGSSVFKNNHLRQEITLQSLRPSFQTIMGNREVFVLSGVAVNRNPVSVREVRIEGHIYNAEGKEIERQTISVGNAISSKIIRDLTAQEISILQKLSPQKRFEISPDESAGFVIVFLKPSGEVKNFSSLVLSAEGGV